MKRCSRLLWENIEAFEKEIGRPQLIMTKIWQMMQSRDTKNLNSDKDFEEIVSKVKQIGWNESTRTTGFRRQEEDADQWSLEHLLRESESIQNFHHWRLDASSIENYVIKNLEVLGTAKPKHRKSISLPAMLEGDVSKRNLKEFTIASNEIQHIVLRNSKVAGPRRSASRWIGWHRQTNPIAHCLRSTRDIRKTGISH